ncbi:IS1-like element transposase [Brenneria alni]|uniref:IS1-like element transposase n=1 Tax=Brenneria alni TaxID=71656 RepID=UPI000EF2567B
MNYYYNAHKPGTKEKIVDMTMNDSGVRDTRRVLKISMNAVMSTLKSSFRGK